MAQINAIITDGTSIAEKISAMRRSLADRIDQDESAILCAILRGEVENHDLTAKDYILGFMENVGSMAGLMESLSAIAARQGDAGEYLLPRKMFWALKYAIEAVQVGAKMLEADHVESYIHSRGIGFDVAADLVKKVHSLESEITRLKTTNNELREVLEVLQTSMHSDQEVLRISKAIIEKQANEIVKLKHP